jgi:hypothetical protein
MCSSFPLLSAHLEQLRMTSSAEDNDQVAIDLHPHQVVGVDGGAPALAGDLRCRRARTGVSGRHTAKHTLIAASRNAAYRLNMSTPGSRTGPAPTVRAHNTRCWSPQSG